ncbi:unnamed protein product, partial [marine sediment metagenome]
DGIIMVIRAGSMPREAVKNAVDRFGTVGTYVLGAILNGIDMGSNGYYYYYDYGEERENKKKAKRERKSKSSYEEA